MWFGGGMMDASENQFETNSEHNGQPTSVATWPCDMCIWKMVQVAKSLLKWKTLHLLRLMISFRFVVLLAFSGQILYKPNFFMNYWVHAVNPTSLWVGRLTKCASPTSQWHFGSIVLVFFVVWIVVTVSVRGDSPSYWCIIIWGYMM